MSAGLSLILKLSTRHCPSAPSVLCYQLRDCLQAYEIQLTVFRNKYLAFARKCNELLGENSEPLTEFLFIAQVAQAPSHPQPQRTDFVTVTSLRAEPSEKPEEAQMDRLRKFCAPEIHLKQGYKAQLEHKFRLIKV